MTAQREFKFWNGPYRCSVRFAGDQVECTRAFFGASEDMIKLTFSRQELSSELTARKWGAPVTIKHMGYPAGCLFLAWLTRTNLPSPWRNASFFFVALFIWWIGVAVDRLQKKDWLEIRKRNGGAAFAIQISGWSTNRRSEFRTAYESFITLPNQSSEPTLSSGTSPAGQEPRLP